METPLFIINFATLRLYDSASFKSERSDQLVDLLTR